MTVKDYAKKQKKSIPLIYKKIREGTIKFEKKFGKYLIKTKCVLVCLFFFACSSESDPEPQIPCQQLKQEIDLAYKAILDHQARSSNGNPVAWQAELERLVVARDAKQGEFTRRRCN
jgi:hypothetical protein